MSSRSPESDHDTDGVFGTLAVGPPTAPPIVPPEIIFDRPIEVRALIV